MEDLFVFGFVNIFMVGFLDVVWKGIGSVVIGICKGWCL